MTKVTMPEPAMFMGDTAANGEADQDYFTLDQMEAYAAAKVREAFEQAAFIADGYVGCEDIADHIRALIPK